MPPLLAGLGALLAGAPWGIPSSQSGSTSGWTREAESAFSLFVSSIGRGREADLCRTLAQCLALPEVNPLFEAADAHLRFTVDCADAVFALRAYFAWKKGLPFLFNARSPARPAELHAVGIGKFASFSEVTRAMRDAVSTESFRAGVDREGTETFPVRVTRETIRPGSVFYDPDGHVLMVYAISEEGNVRFIDSQPNGLLAVRRLPGDSYESGQAPQGGGFRAWRPLEWRASAGLLNGGWVFVSNSGLSDLDSAGEQYEKRLLVRGSEVGFWTWVRDRLAQSDGRIRPVGEFRARLEQLCDDVAERAAAVDLAINAALPGRRHIPALPRNVYRTQDGLWEAHATPARDRSLRRSMRALRRFVENTYRMVAERRSTHLNYPHSERELLEEYEAVWQELRRSPRCGVSYRGSDGERRFLSLTDVVGKAYGLSFNPYHCIELRWGTQPVASSASNSCSFTPVMKKSYAKERELRMKLDAKVATGASLPPQESLDFVAALEGLRSGAGRPLL